MLCVLSRIMFSRNHQTRQLRSGAPKHYFGEETVDFIAHWLNEREKSKEGQGIAQFIEAINALWNKGEQVEPGCAGLREKRRIASQLQRMFLRLISRFKSHPYFGQMIVDARSKHETKILWRPAAPSEWSKAKAGTVFSAFLWLVSQGLRERLTRCQHCSRWMFAKVSGKKGQTFCSHACRQGHYAASQKVKDRRADYMKEWRRRAKLSM